MCEEAFDEVIIPCEDGMVLHVTGGYGRNEVCLGIHVVRQNATQIAYFSANSEIGKMPH